MTIYFSHALNYLPGNYFGLVGECEIFDVDCKSQLCRAHDPFSLPLWHPS